MGVALLCRLGLRLPQIQAYRQLSHAFFIVYNLTAGRVKQTNFKMKKSLFIAFAVGLGLTASLMAQVPSYSSHKTFGGTGNDAANKVLVDSNGNQVIFGSFTGTVDFDPNSGVYNLTSNGSDDMFILKLDNLGNFLWAKSIGGSGSDNIYNAVINNQGDIIFAGIYQNTVDLDPGAGTFNLTAAGAQDFIVEKLDNNGNFIFCKVVSGPFSDIVTNLKLDSFGNIYSVGWFTGSSTDFDPGPNVFPLSASGSDAFIWKLDPNGNLLWVKKIGGSGNDSAIGLDIDQQGNVLVSGDFISTTDFDPSSGVFNITPIGSNDAFVVKLDSNGGFIWAIRAGGSLSESASRIACDLNGSVYIGGNFNGTADFDPGNGTYNITSQGQNDIFLIKVDSGGNFQWAKSIGGSGQEGITDITLETGGHFYVSGIFQNTVDLDPGLSVSSYTSAGLDDSFYSLFDQNGNQVWVSTLGSSGNDAISNTLSYQGSIYLAGAFNNTADFDPNSGIQNSTSNGLQDAFVLKLNSNSCTYTFYDTVTVYQYDTLITNITVYDTITTNIYDTTYVTINDTLLTTVTDTLIISTTLGLPAPNNENTILIYPNPASDHITIDNGNFAAMAGYSIKIENNAGQQVFQSAINQAQFYVDLSTWTGNGLYFVHLIDPQNNTVTVRKIVLQ